MEADIADLHLPTGGVEDTGLVRDLFQGVSGILMSFWIYDINNVYFA